MERKTIIIERADGSIEVNGPPDLIQKAMEAERRTAGKKEGIFSGMGKGLEIGKPQGSSMPSMPDMGLNMSGMKGKSGLPSSSGNFGLDIGQMKKPQGFGSSPSVGKLEKPTKGFGDIVGKGSSLPEMPSVRMPDSFGLNLRKDNKEVTKKKKK